MKKLSALIMIFFFFASFQRRFNIKFPANAKNTKKKKKLIYFFDFYYFFRFIIFFFFFRFTSKSLLLMGRKDSGSNWTCGAKSFRGAANRTSQTNLVVIVCKLICPYRGMYEYEYIKCVIKYKMCI